MLASLWSLLESVRTQIATRRLYEHDEQDEYTFAKDRSSRLSDRWTANIIVDKLRRADFRSC